MTATEQRIVIAEHLGYRKISEIFTYDNKTRWATPRNYFRAPDSDYGNKLLKNQKWGWEKPADWARDEPNWTDVPDYLNDLNAMNKAEKTLTHPKDIEYGILLADYFEGIKELAVSATAAQRAEAFLRVIGKWKNEKKNKKTLV